LFVVKNLIYSLLFYPVLKNRAAKIILYFEFTNKRLIFF
jgi:hypothetical protein